MDTHITVGPAVEGGWRCVDDSGRVVFLPREAVDTVVRDLRVGQRLTAEVSGGTATRASLA